MRTRSTRHEFDPLSPLPPSAVRPPTQQQRPRPPPPPPPPLPAGIRPLEQQQQQQQQHQQQPPPQRHQRGQEEEGRQRGREEEEAKSSDETIRRPQIIQQQQQQQQQQQANDERQPMVQRQQPLTHTTEVQGNIDAANAAPEIRTLGQPQQQQDDDDDSWVLRLQIRREDGRPYTTVGVHVTPDMNAERLSACLRQAFASVMGGGGSSSSIGRGSLSSSTSTLPITGLFVERNGLFVSLEHLLQTPSLQKHKFDLIYYPPAPLPPPPTPWFHEMWFWMLLSGPVLIAIIYQLLQLYGHEIWLGITWLAASLYDATVQLPLQELYRYGPWFIGWEGSPMASICARITYYGDSSFWSRNMQECQDIYASKEQAFLRVARPTLYALIVLILLWLVAQLLQHWRQVARYQHARATAAIPPREVSDTYRALQVLLRVVRKELEPAQPPHRQQPQPQRQNGPPPNEPSPFY